MGMMRLGYDHDSFDTILAIQHHLEVHSESIKSCLKGKKYQRYIESLLDYLLMNHDERRRFLGMGGRISAVVDDLGIVQKLVDENE